MFFFKIQHHVGDANILTCVTLKIATVIWLFFVTIGYCIHSSNPLPWVCYFTTAMLHHVLVATESDV